MVVGFAAETDDVLANGRAKLKRKGCDLLVVNEVGSARPVGSGENEAVILGADGSETPVAHGPKEALAEDVVGPRGGTARLNDSFTPPGSRTPPHSSVALAKGASFQAECSCRRSQPFREARRVGPWWSATDKLFSNVAGCSSPVPSTNDQPAAAATPGALCPVACSPWSP